MKRKTLITLGEWVVAVALLFLLFKLEVYPLGTFRSADATHALSERSLHYGPSKVAKKVTVPFDSHQIVYLGTYKDWFSADLVVKRGFGWELGNGESGIKIDRSKPLTYSWGMNQSNKKIRLAKFYGYVSDPLITTVVLRLRGTELRQTIADDRMFLFLWNDAEKNYVWLSIQGLDNAGNVLYEQELQ